MPTRLITLVCYLLNFLIGVGCAILVFLGHDLRNKMIASKPVVSPMACLLFKTTALGFLATSESLLVGLVGFLSTLLRVRRLENILCACSFAVAHVYLFLTVMFAEFDPLQHQLLRHNVFMLSQERSMPYHMKCRTLVDLPMDPIMIFLYSTCYLRVFQTIASLLYLRNSSKMPYYFSGDN